MPRCLCTVLPLSGTIRVVTRPHRRKATTGPVAVHDGVRESDETRGCRSRVRRETVRRRTPQVHAGQADAASLCSVRRRRFQRRRFPPRTCPDESARRWNGPKTRIVLSLRRHGESSAIASVLTRGRGRQAGLVRGARSRAARGFLQPGSAIRATWRARLAEHLGTLTWEPDRPSRPMRSPDPRRLAALSSACALADAALARARAHMQRCSPG